MSIFAYQEALATNHRVVIDFSGLPGFDNIPGNSDDVPFPQSDSYTTGPPCRTIANEYSSLGVTFSNIPLEYHGGYLNPDGMPVLPNTNYWWLDGVVADPTNCTNGGGQTPMIITFLLPQTTVGFDLISNIFSSGAMIPILLTHQDGTTSQTTLTPTNAIIDGGDMSQQRGRYLITSTNLYTSIQIGLNNNTGSSHITNLNFTSSSTAITNLTNGTTILTKNANATNVQIGDTVIFTYNETNDGTIPLYNVLVTDDSCSPLNLISNGNNDNVLDPGESWIYQCSVLFTTNGTFTNTAIGFALDSFGNPVTFPSDPDEIATSTVVVVPEFGTMAVMLLGITVTLGFFLQRSKRLAFLNQ